MSPIKLVFYGTPEFAVPVLEHLAKDERFRIVGLVTQPDRPVGRHATLTAPPVKITAQKFTIPIFQFEKIKNEEALAKIQSLNADIAVVASFGQIIPQTILDLYPHGMINVHPSLLPKYRGATPIPAAIKNGDDVTGVSIMKMDALMDHGPILTQVTEPIRQDDTTETLGMRLFKVAADILPEIIIQYIHKQLEPREQHHEEATSVKLLSREEGLIDWTKNAEEIERTIRAYDPWPGTFTVADGTRLKILQAHPSVIPHESSKRGDGTKIILDDSPAFVCGNGTALIIDQVQPEGKSVMSGKDFLRGRLFVSSSRVVSGKKPTNFRQKSRLQYPMDDLNTA